MDASKSRTSTDMGNSYSSRYIRNSNTGGLISIPDISTEAWFVPLNYFMIALASAVLIHRCEYLFTCNEQVRFQYLSFNWRVSWILHKARFKLVRVVTDVYAFTTIVGSFISILCKFYNCLQNHCRDNKKYSRLGYT